MSRWTAIPLVACLFVTLVLVAALFGRLRNTEPCLETPPDEPKPTPNVAVNSFDARFPTKVYAFVDFHGDEYLLSPRHSGTARDLVRSLFLLQEAKGSAVTQHIPRWGTDNQITLYDGTSGFGPKVVQLFIFDEFKHGGDGSQLALFLCVWEPERKIYQFSIPIASDEHARLMSFVKGLGSAVDIFVDQLTDDIALRMLGPNAKAAVPALLRALSDQDERVRLDVLKALVEIGGDEDRVVTELAKEFDRGGSANRLESLLMLADQLGVDSAPLVPRLAGYLRDKKQTTEVRLWAARALKSIGTPAQAAASDLLAALEDPVPDDGNWLYTMMTALGKVGLPPEAVPVLLRLATADSTRADEAGEAMLLLAGIPDPPEGTLRALAKELERKQSSRRFGAAAALIRLQHKADVAAAVLRDGFSSTHEDTCLIAIEYVGKLESAGVPFLLDLAALEKSGNKRIRDWAADAIKKIRKNLKKGQGTIPVGMETVILPTIG